MSDDLESILTYFEVYQWEEIFLIGFSLGGNLIGKFIGEKGKDIDSKIKKVILVSAPLDLNKSMIKMSKGFNWFYNYHFTYLLKIKFRKKCQAHPHVFDKKAIKNIKNLREFDDKITGPYFGFKDAMTYYEWGSCINYIQNSRVPIFIIQAIDDPIVDVSLHQDLTKHVSSFITTILTEKGGHVGFFGYGNGCKNAHGWLSHTICNLIDNV